MASETVQLLASVVKSSAPLIYAGLGETLTEKVGVINLSLDGSVMLSAAVGFATATVSGNVWLGIVIAMAVSALVALLVALCSIELRQEQVAVGFVLFALCTDLANFIGSPYTGSPGVKVPHWTVPVLSQIPAVGDILFDHDVIVYLSYVAILVVWWWMYKTQPGLKLLGVGERPQAAFARGVDVNRLRYLYTALGGALVGLGGATYAFVVKTDWNHNLTRGNGWIALAIVIFGGWHPFRVAFGAYLFGGLGALAINLQRRMPRVPTQVFNAAPFALMLLVLLLVSSGATDRIIGLFPRRFQRPLRDVLRGSPPGGLGTVFTKE
jgi:simple sugar transport system permease protein